MNKTNDKKSKLLPKLLIVLGVLIVILAVITFINIRREAISKYDIFSKYSEEIHSLQNDPAKLEATDYKQLFEAEVADVKTPEDEMPDVHNFHAQTEASTWITEPPFNDICENNRKQLESTRNFGGKFTREYISVNTDENFRYAVLLQVKKLSDEICGDAETDFEKVKRLSHWTANNIYYDMDAAHNTVDISVISLENVLSGRKTTCAGFSNLFSSMCSMQGIYCVNLRGGTAADGYTPETIRQAPTNHEWTAVICDGKWAYVDTTWSSQNRSINGKLRYSGVNRFYLLMSFENMSCEHRIDIADHRDFVNCLDEK